jgi:putative membrane protein|tara:strand:- start:3924 stop:4484 length:561 start_codon:yes stop_codon:yes gene_type:complete
MPKKNKYGIWIKIVSVVIPTVVAILFGVKIDYQLPIFLPPVYASINALTAVLLVLALIAIKSKKILLHSRLMKTCIALSLLFLVMYIAYHMTSSSTIYGDLNKDGSRSIEEGVIIGKSLYLYLTILLTHIVLSIALIPLVLISYVRAFQEEFDSHRKISRITFPIWLYVATTGVVVYWMIEPYYLY